jgi:hypothetical protein
MNDPMIGFYFKLLLAVAAAGLVSYIMNVLQKRKEREADRQFKLTLKAYGLSEEVIEKPKGESNDPKN